MPCFTYGEKEITHLKKRDKRLGAAIEAIGPLHREVTPDIFSALVYSIVAQQISSKAARTVCDRLLARIGDMRPAPLVALDVADIQQCGMSLRKAGYIHGAARAVHCGELDLTEISSLPDDAVIARLSALNGIGVWTAEMLLIFSLCRPDVVSWGDLAIRRGMMRLYGLKKLDKTQFERYRTRYAPYGSVASLYLWALAT